MDGNVPISRSVLVELIWCSSFRIEFFSVYVKRRLWSNLVYFRHFHLCLAELLFFFPPNNLLPCRLNVKMKYKKNMVNFKTYSKNSVRPKSVLQVPISNRLYLERPLLGHHRSHFQLHHVFLVLAITGFHKVTFLASPFDVWIRLKHLCKVLESNGIFFLRELINHPTFFIKLVSFLMC